MCSAGGQWGTNPIGLLHSEIPGSKCACHSPRLIAACHVLRRLMVPRHPSCARIRLAEGLPSRRIETLPLGLRCISQNTFNCQRSVYRSWTHLAELVGVPGIGPGTSSLSGTRSNQLSYTPSLRLVRKGCDRQPAPGLTLPYVPIRRLLRKEVIQPLVPQRLPCYDFIPITTHTFDGAPLAVGHSGIGCRRLS